MLNKMLYSLKNNIRIEVIEYPDYILFNCNPFNANITETMSFIYNILYSTLNEFGLNKGIYDICLEFIISLYRLQHSQLTQKPIYISGLSYGGAISQILGAVFYNLKTGIEKNYPQFKIHPMVDLQLPTFIVSCGAFRVGNEGGRNYLQKTGIPIFNYVACDESKNRVDVVSLLPGKDYTENINTIYFDAYQNREVRMKVEEMTTSLFQNLLHFGSNLYNYKFWLNHEEFNLHNGDVYSYIKSRYNVSI